MLRVYRSDLNHLFRLDPLAGTVDPPLKIKTTKMDHTEVNGLVTSYDKDGLEVMDLQKKTTKVAWEDFQPGTAVNLFAQVRATRDADEWEDLGKTLLTVPGGKGPAINALHRAQARSQTQRRNRRDQSKTPPCIRSPQRDLSAPSRR